MYSFEGDKFSTALKISNNFRKVMLYQYLGKEVSAICRVTQRVVLDSIIVRATTSLIP